MATWDRNHICPEVELPAECSVELREKDKPTVLATEEHSDVGELIDCQRYGTIQKLLNVTERVLEFVRYE